MSRAPLIADSGGIAVCLLLCGPLSLAGCGNYPMERFERLCRDQGGIRIHDPAGWSQYLTELKRLAREQGGDRIVIGPVEGYTYESDVTRGRADVQNRRPFRDDVYIGRAGRPLATLANFMVYQRGFDGGGHVDCAGSYPEIYLRQPGAEPL